MLADTSCCGPCKTESSQKPVPVHPRLADALSDWRKQCVYTKPGDGFLPAGAIGVGDRVGDKRSCANTSGRLHKELESRNALAGTRFAIRIRRCCEPWALNSKLCRSCCVIQHCDPHWMSIPRQSRRPNMQRRLLCWR